MIWTIEKIEVTSGRPQLFILSAVLTKHENGGTSINSNLAYRIATDGKDAVVGRYVQHVLEANPGFCLAGKIAVMEIPREDLAHMEPPETMTGDAA